MANPVYFPTSLATNSGRGNTLHLQTRFRPPHGVSLHPLQRAGAVPATSHDLAPTVGAFGPPGLGQPRYAAGRADVHSWPPLVPTAGSPRDPRMMVS